MSVLAGAVHRVTGGARPARATAGVAMAPVGAGGVGPYWLERQTDPASPSFVPCGQPPAAVNVTHRNWTVVGNLDSAGAAIVDPRGLITPRPGGWSLDWWVGADDRWHLPSREVAVRQRLVGASPVVETAMGIPSGDAVQRVYAVRRSSAEGGAELVVVEVENASPLPVALALAVRPYNPDGAAVVRGIDLRGSAVTVDGRVALLLPGPPRRVAAGALGDGDPAVALMAGGAGEAWGAPVHDPAGAARAVFVYPLVHGATFRAAVPLDAPPRAGRPTAARRRPAAVPKLPGSLAPAAAVATGWRAQSDRGMRLVLPDDRLAEAVAANRRFLLLLHDRPAYGRGPARGDRRWSRQGASVLHALGQYGYHDEVARQLAGPATRRRGDGALPRGPGVRDDDGAALVALARHWRLARDTPLVEAAVEPIARAARRIERQRRRPARRRHRHGSVPAGGGVRADPDGDALWGVAGLRAAAELLEVAGQPRAAAGAAGGAVALWPDVEASLAATAARLAAVSTGSRRWGDGGAVAALAACAPLDLLPADDPRIAGAADALRAWSTSDGGRAVVHGTGCGGLGTSETMRLAAVELRAGDRAGLDRLAWVLDAATPTWTWPEAVHPRLGGGCAGEGHHGPVAAEVLSFVRDLLVREVAAAPAGGPPGVALSSLVPAAWYGRGWEVHDAPTAHGVVSYAVRWHGERAALLWEVDPHPGTGDVRITAPGLDPAWSTTERRGDALLGPVPPPPTAPTAGSQARRPAPAAAAERARPPIEGGSFA